MGQFVVGEDLRGNSFDLLKTSLAWAKAFGKRMFTLHAEKLADALKRLAKQQLQLEMISNRGAKVWPGEMKETFCVDCYRCRFFLSKQEKQGAKQIASFLAQLAEDQLDVTQVQYLFHFDGKAGYSSSTQL